MGAVELARAAEALGAGELMLNCIDQDGTNQARLHAESISTDIQRTARCRS